ncbi:uncharacterized protein KNAG_0H01650 [Huiozyma naganishii CBS 8797]|uniref:Uncharacterized protein n=1 Tax=Huiozyma naganishii (strain ATCC MYA-139 / BCRC 22969 / CBS 8797 / KCTC 17520 / NBRC 10181 / NCYC 3082 / Yp74L-3) TaxID=1071383 RepID=J7R9P4_HUIN7|nr:hypothetical protein KNAG_0H01650 [Kazachstania naganishii CBS 8797]CCK71580.1 hypothetical protein KNAG_0H01650 [Kazachstania naganishii CBS 8797]
MNLVVFSGGTATNSLTPSFYNLTVSKGHELTYVLPISDNGGSTSEILRVLGGPAIGDIRSRIVRLLEDEKLVIVFGYRLSEDCHEAKREWNEIVEGTHQVWKAVPQEVKEMCRAFIIHINSELLKKSKSYANRFKFEKASIGNLFLTGARLFLGSLDASIELMMRIGRCNPKVNVIPCINTSHTHHISALLTNGDVITGQSQISHPSKPSVNRAASRHGTLMNEEQDLFENSLNAGSNYMDGMNKGGTIAIGPSAENSMVEEQGGAETEEEEEYANPIYILPELKNSQLHFDKCDSDEMLPAPIRRILYINPYGEEIKPLGNSRAVSKIKEADMIVYSIGSLMTSLMPIIILGNIASTILDCPKKHKILIINNKYDRETFGHDAYHYVKMVVESMTRAVMNYRQTRGIVASTLKNLKWDCFITDIIYLTGGDIQMDWGSLSEHNIVCHGINSDKLSNEDLEVVLKKIHSLST